MRTVLPWLLILAMTSVAGPSCKGRGGAAFFRSVARVAITAAAAVAAAAASRKRDVPPQPPVLAPSGLAVPGPFGAKLIPALGSIADCPSAPAVEVQGCLQPGLFRTHDSWSACAYFCLDHCEYHGAAQATIRPLTPAEAGPLGPRRTLATPPAPPPIEAPAPPPPAPPPAPPPVEPPQS